MKTSRATVAFLVIAASMLSSCRRSQRTHSSAQALGIASTTESSDVMLASVAALSRDAARRQHAFLEAVAPGHLFAATRVSQGEIDRGEWQPDALFEIGAQLFEHPFTRSEGFGARDLPSYSRFQRGRRGGPDAFRCVSCHWRGGPAGAGDVGDNAFLDGDGSTEHTALVRNPRSLHGAGVIESIAREMSATLQAQRAALIERARTSGRPVRAEIIASGVSFGAITSLPDGSIDAREVRGVSSDLVVRPFGWKGDTESIRDAVEEELLVHHGMQSTHLVASGSTERVGSFGGSDPDGDGVRDEISEGQVTALAMFIAMQDVPVIAPPTSRALLDAYRAGEQAFARIGCTDCHTPTLPLADTHWRLSSREQSTSIVLDLMTTGSTPRLARAASGVVRVALYSDLRRHDMGAGLAEPRDDGDVPGRMFITPPLWGLLRTGPFLHDGRAPTLEEAILEHGGEARAARDAFAALDEAGRGSIRVFLTGFIRAPRIRVP